MTRHSELKGPQLNRRRFCGRALVGSAGVVLMAKGLDVAAADQENLAIYPPMKIKGAERVTPGSFLYFNYPGRNDQAVLVRNAEGEYIAFSRKCVHLGCSIEFDALRRC